MSHAARFVREMKARGLTLSLAESMTCGMAADKLANAVGTSDVLLASLVCYTPEAKRKLLGLSKSLIDKYTCESMQVTEAMARKLAKLMPASVCAAITGLASDGGSETKSKPVGTVFFCVKYGKHWLKERKVFRGTPLQIREKACEQLFQMILTKIKQ